MIQGKYAYMSPEQARGGAVDARSDQYALSVMLYELRRGAGLPDARGGAGHARKGVTQGTPCGPLGTRRAAAARHGRRARDAARGRGAAPRT